MVTKIIFYGFILAYGDIQRVSCSTIPMHDDTVTTTTAAHIEVDENMARLLQEFFTSVDSAVIRRDRGWDGFTSIILDKILNGLDMDRCSEKLGSYVLGRTLHDLEHCRQYRSYNEKINRFDTDKRTMEREMETVYQDVLAEAMAMCRSSSTIIGYETECSENPSEHIRLRFRPLYDKVKNFSAYAFSLFHDDIRDVQDNCYSSEALDIMLDQAKQDNSSICS